MQRSSILVLVVTRHTLVAGAHSQILVKEEEQKESSASDESDDDVEVARAPGACRFLGAVLCRALFQVEEKEPLEEMRGWLMCGSFAMVCNGQCLWQNIRAQVTVSPVGGIACRLNCTLSPVLFPKIQAIPVSGRAPGESISWHAGSRRVFAVRRLAFFRSSREPCSFRPFLEKALHPAGGCPAAMLGDCATASRHPRV